MKNKTPFTVTITALSHEGRGIARLNEKTQFIENALVGEEVRVKPLKHHSRFDEGVAMEILSSPSPDRVTPPCPHYLICGGCRLQHMDSAAQIRFKAQQLKEQLTHFGGCSAKHELLALQAETLGYRRKARLGIKWNAAKNKMVVGFREVNGRVIADLSICPVLHPRFGLLITPLSNMLAQLSNREQIPQCEWAMGDDDAALIFRHMIPFTEKDLVILKAFGKEHSLAIFLQPGGPQSISKIFPEDQPEPWLYYELPSHQLRFAFYPTDFTQVNTSMNRQMIDQALRLLELNSEDRVLDLFCGIGNFSLPIARYAHSVLGVEGDVAMTQRAEMNAALNQLTNTRFVAADLTKNFAFAKNLSINKVLIDPPRSGALEVLPHVVALKPERIVYVSCNPSTLARDAKYLTQHRYELVQAGVMDMFPHTQHVESMALFVRT